jgi:hypothetical protein
MKKILLFLFCMSVVTLSLHAQKLTKMPNPGFEKHFMSKAVAELAAKAAPREVSLKKIEEKSDSGTLYLESCKNWFEKNNIRFKAISFDDGFEMSPMKALVVETNWVSKYKTLETKDKTYYLSHVSEQDHVIIFYYGDKPDEFQIVNNVSVVVVRDRLSEKVKIALDLTEYAYSPVYEPKVKMHVYQDALWAHVDNEAIYVSTAHWTYSNTTNDHNGYITAISLKTKKVLWRSAAKVSNSINFCATEDMLLSAYGYTREGAKVYALDKKTGKITGQVEIATSKSGKKHIEFLYLDGKTLHLKAIDNTEYKVSVN